ncbi:MAG: tRNA-specific 2-thiouridylase MnmA [candidate division TM6 bacterium GW2011_GWF2_43_17]|nr:MAG: tRNA-specific 2-thiouridylase MnmA [candidate division TM6 bacterium GW2011_GWF2_43_17]HAU30578.1 tRNA 2-thiouridine(34) synthase MnmA [Candidatus Dependentiae bacterium]
MNIAVLLSGGVDSSVALCKLQEAGHQITAFYLKIWLEDELSFLGSCPWEEDLLFARAVCAQRNVPLEVVSFQQVYWQRVVSYTIEQVRAGRTPNPDMLCNQQVKFGAFLDQYGEQFDRVATGHYACVKHQTVGAHLFSTPDLVKDQTYFLAYLSQQQLAKAIFPLCDMTKEQVRTAAQEFQLPNKDRKDSQGICFLGKIKFSDFIRAHVGEQEGPLVEFESGAVVGMHKGFWFFTLGQRQGIGLSGGPWYVVAKDPKANKVFISRSYYDLYKNRESFFVDGLNWFTQGPRDGEILEVKLRHGPHRYRAQVLFEDSGVLRVVLLDGSDQGIAPGQFAVFYRENECLGGGSIQERLV